MENVNVFKDVMIDEDKHGKELQDAASASKGNLISMGVVSLEKLYDLHNHFRDLLMLKPIVPHYFTSRLNWE